MKKLLEKNIELIGRKKLVYELEYPKQTTPKKEEILKKLSEITKATPELIKIKKIDTYFGLEKATITAYVYKDQKTFETFEKINKKKKEENKEGAPTQAPKQEAPKKQEKPKKEEKK